VTRRQRIADLTTFAQPSQPALSPDGREAVYVLTTVDAAADKNVSSLWRVTVAGPGAGAGSARPLTTGTGDVAPAWSPDGTKIAFLRADGGPAQLWLLPAGGGEPERITSLPLGAGAPVWSPDGTKIAFGAPVDLAAMPGEDDAARARRATAPVVNSRINGKADGAGLLGTIRKHLHVLDLASFDGAGFDGASLDGDSRALRQVTEGDWHAGDPVWSPDSARLAFGAATAADVDLRLRAPVYTVDVSGGFARPRQVALADGLGAPTAWTPDGSALIVAGGPSGPFGHLNLLRVPLDGDITDLARSLDRNVMPGGPGYPGGLPTLTDGGATVLFCVRDRGCTHLYTVAADGSAAPRPVVAGALRLYSDCAA